MPTLLDIGGLPDQMNDSWKEVLNMIFFGRVPENENLLDVHDYVIRTGELRWPRYFRTYNHLKVDRVVVVGSATAAVAKNLLQTVVRAARPLNGPSRRSIPIFGVMTKTDLVDPDVDELFLEIERTFKDCLGLNRAEHRYLRCINYCSAIDPDNDRIWTRFPYLDVPVLRLMTQICDPAVEVVNRNQIYPFLSLLKEKSIWLSILLVIWISVFLHLFIRFFG